jgi:hypothetical protein
LIIPLLLSPQAGKRTLHHLRLQFEQMSHAAQKKALDEALLFGYLAK